MKTAVLIPCYNEAKTIGKVVADFKEKMPHADIYVYDNNSTDNTAQIAEQAGAIVRYEHKQGKGNVVRAMFREVEADCFRSAAGKISAVRPGRYGGWRPPFLHLFH